MVLDGLVSRWNIQEFYGMHNMPGMPVGTFAIKPGAMMAAADQFDIIVTGKGGHAAKPHECIDTTLTAAQIIVAATVVAPSARLRHFSEMEHAEHPFGDPTFTGRT